MTVTGRRCRSAERAGDQARERLPEPRHRLALRERAPVGRAGQRRPRAAGETGNDL